MIGEIIRAVVFVGVLALFVTVMACMWHEFTRPLDESDALCARVDDDLDAMYGNGHGAR